MLRFYDKEIFCVEYDNLNRSELRSFFLKGNQEEIVCVLQQGNYMGYITWPSLLKSGDIYEGIQKEYVTLDETVWEKGRQYFAGHKTVFGEAVQLPVLSREGQLLCFAYQDEEANRELRMLRELEECEGALTFFDVNPEYIGVTIHGFNELAYYMDKYLMGLGLAVNVEGELWKEFGIRESHAVMAHENYEIWAEGVWQKSRELQDERLRSVSAEFECVDKIYEANIKAGRISDAEEGRDWLLEKLRDKREIVIIGTDMESQDAYDWLLGNGIDIRAFLTEGRAEGQRRLFGKPVLGKVEILNRFHDVVFIECHSKYSAWGFGDVDHYDYEGYRRNVRYFLLRDYTEIVGNNLQHVLLEKDILFAGDVDLCSRVWKWWRQCRIGTGKAGYWDILEESEPEIRKLQIPSIERAEAEAYDMVMLVAPEYDSISGMPKDGTRRKYDTYIKKLKECGICDYTDYFSYASKLAGLEIKEEMEIRKELRPLGIVIGAIPWHSGNILMKQIFDGHPQIMLMEEYNYLSQNLYFICSRLAEKESSDILTDFWLLYQKEAGEGAIKKDFPDRERFHQKMKELLGLGSRFTSQELFVMFHIAYEAMYGREISNLNNKMIYWEPHSWGRDVLRRWSYWLGGSSLRGFVLSTVRNSYIRAGSRIKESIGKKPVWGSILWLGTTEKGNKTLYKGWTEHSVKFEDLKKKPKETLTDICEWLHIAFDEILMKTTFHGNEAFYKEMKGLDLMPVYNPYEEYFTAFDRMRLCLLNSSFQKKHGYPFVNLLDFSRRELQEMFLKEFRWEKIPEAVAGKDEAGVWLIQEMVRKRLWQMRFNELMDKDEIF